MLAPPTPNHVSMPPNFKFQKITLVGRGDLGVIHTHWEKRSGRKTLITDSKRSLGYTDMNIGQASQRSPTMAVGPHHTHCRYTLG